MQVLPALNLSVLRLAPREQGGFTLLELLVAITVFSLIAVTVYGAVRLGARSWDAGEARSETSSQMRLVEGFVRRYLSKAYPLLVKDETGKSRLQFEGKPDRLRFVTDMPSHLEFPGLYEITLEVVEEGGENRLDVIWRLFHPDLKQEAGAGEPEDEELSDTTVLVDGLDSAKFEYFGLLERGDDTPQWHERWKAQARELPPLIRLKVTTKAGGHWPELVIRLYVDSARSYQRAGSQDDDIELPDDEETNDEGLIDPEASVLPE